MNEMEVAVKVEAVSPVKKKIIFDIPWYDVKKELDDVYRKVSKQAKIKGFRNGKVPRKVLESYYKEHAEGETIVNLINRFYWEALKQNNIEAITYPQIDQGGIVENSNFSFTATVEIEPIIEPYGYLDLELEKDEFEVTDEDVELRLQELRKMFATLEEVHEDDKEVLDGDFVLIDFRGSLNGKQLDELKADNYLLEVGSKSFVPGFEDQLIGMKKGESRQIKVIFPDDYYIKQIAGNEVLFSVILKNIKVKVLPDVDDNFIKNFEKYKSLEALKNDIHTSLEEECKTRSNSALKNSILDRLLAKNEFDVPPSFVEKQIFYMMNETQKRLTLGGMDNKEAMELSFKFHDQYRDDATKIIKSLILIKNIAKKESIDVDKKEIEERIRYSSHKNDLNPQSLKESPNYDNITESTKNEILNDKVFKFIEERAKITVLKRKMNEKLEGN